MMLTDGISSIYDNFQGSFCNLKSEVIFHADEATKHNECVDTFSTKSSLINVKD